MPIILTPFPPVSCSEFIVSVRFALGRQRYPRSGDGSMGAPSGLDFVLAHLKVLHCATASFAYVGIVSTAFAVTQSDFVLHLLVCLGHDSR